MSERPKILDNMRAAKANGNPRDYAGPFLSAHDSWHVASYVSDLESRLEKAEAERDTLSKWRELALQFDMHRMEAMGIIRAFVESPIATISHAESFLAKPPRNGAEAAAVFRNEELVRAQNYLRGLPSFGDGRWAASHLDALKSPTPDQGDEA